MGWEREGMEACAVKFLFLDGNILQYAFGERRIVFVDR